MYTLFVVQSITPQQENTKSRLLIFSPDPRFLVLVHPSSIGDLLGTKLGTKLGSLEGNWDGLVDGIGDLLGTKLGSLEGDWDGLSHIHI